jgi:hypothetical protein
MDDLLKRVAEAGLALGAAEEALEEGRSSVARDALDETDEILAELRGRWPQMNGAERAMVGRTAAPLRGRLEAARRRVPPLRAVSESAPEVDPEQDIDPDGPPTAA